MEEYELVLRGLVDFKNYDVGGGVACAYVGAMACGLLGMTCNLSRDKDYGLEEGLHQNLGEELEEIKEFLLKALVDDYKSFSQLQQAIKMPIDSVEERSLRNKYISKYAIEAAKVPLENAKKIKRIYEISQIMDNKSNPYLKSDIYIGREFAKIGINGCLENVKANLQLIEDKEIIMEFINVIKETEIL